MMRKGDLAQFPAEWVLRQASEEGLSGGIEFESDPPVCVYLSDGDVYHAVVDGRDPDDGGDLDETTEARLRTETVAALRQLLLSADAGWYFFHDLNHHPLRGAWQWSTERLLAEAAADVAAEEAAADPLAPWLTARVSLCPAPPPSPLTSDQWAVIAAALGQAEVAAVIAALTDEEGWPRERVAAALTELAAAAVVARHDPPPAEGLVSQPITAGPVTGTRDRPPPAAPQSAPAAPPRLGRPRLVSVPMPPSGR